MHYISNYQTGFVETVGTGESTPMFEQFIHLANIAE